MKRSMMESMKSVKYKRGSNLNGKIFALLQGKLSAVLLPHSHGNKHDWSKAFEIDEGVGHYFSAQLRFKQHQVA